MLSAAGRAKKRKVRSIVPRGAWQLLGFVRVEVYEVDETVGLVDIRQIDVLSGRQTLGVSLVIGSYFCHCSLAVHARWFPFLGLQSSQEHT